MFDKLLAFIHSILDKSIPANDGVYWGDMEMMTPYEGWHDYLKIMFAQMGWGTIFLVVASALLWTIVYIEIIRRLYIDHAPSMPWVCLCMNFSWEFQFAFLVPYPEPITRWGIYLWVFFDAIMYVLDLRYGRLFYHKRFAGFDWAYYPIKICVFILMFILVLMMNPQWPSLPDAPAYAAYLMNAIMSVLFCVHMFSRETVEGLSIWVAWCKFLGTLAPTLIGIIWMPGNPFGKALGACCAIFDIMYIYLLTVRFHQFGLNPYNRKPLKGKEDVAEKTYAALADYKERSAAFKLLSYQECKAFRAAQAEERLNK